MERDVSRCVACASERFVPKRLRAVLLGALMVASNAVFAMDDAADEASQIEVISRPVAGAATANFFSLHPAIDASGNVIAFSSSANDLVAGDAGPLHDVYVYTRETGGVSGITLGGNNNSGFPAVSSDGRYVAFVSGATNLNSNDGNGENPNVFLFDRQTEALQLGPAISDSPFSSSIFNRPGPHDRVKVSENGAVVAFISSAANLVLGGPADNGSHLYLWFPNTDRVRGVALQADSGVFDIDLSDDGRFVVFSSSATNILESSFPDRNTARLYLYNSEAGTIEVLLDGRGAVEPSISADGRHLAFRARESDFVNSTNPNFAFQIFSLDTQTDSITLVSKDIPNPPPVPPDASVGSGPLEISGDGMYITFVSKDTRFAPNDNNGAPDVFLWERSTEQIKRITAGANRESDSPAISEAGDVVVFSSAATNLVDVADNNGFRDVFAWRSEASPPPAECEQTPSGVLSSSSGVTVNLQGTNTCFGSGLFSYGTPDSDGIRIPAARGRPELSLVPVNAAGLPANDLIFYRYTSTLGQDLYATNFVARDSGYNVFMTFKATTPFSFDLYELVVFEQGEQSRRNVVYREQDSQWVFSSQDVGDVLNVSVTLFRDLDDNAVRSSDESGANGWEVALYRCGNQDGLAGTLRTGADGKATFSTLELGFYQLAVNLSRFSRFSSAAYDSAGNLTNTIKAVFQTEQGLTGYTACTDFTGGTSTFAEIGIVPNR